MKIDEIIKIAKKQGLPSLPKKKADLIRAIQKSENNSECYATAISSTCGQDTCLWRTDCVKED